MKRNTFIFVLMMLMGMMASHRAYAQKVDMETGLVVWEGSTVQDALDITAQGGFFFLVEFKDELDVDNKEKYVNARGNYGVQAVMSSVAMRLQLITSQRAVNLGGNQPTEAYQFISRIENSANDPYLGDRMGADNENAFGNDAGHSIYLDRSGDRTYWEGDTRNCNNLPNWTFNHSTSYKLNVRYKGESTPQSVAVNTYTIQNVDTRRCTNGDWNNPQYAYRATYIKIQDGRLVTTFNANEATKFIIVSEADFDEAMQQVTWGEVDLGVFIQDATFGRDNKDGIYWVWENAEEEDDGHGNTKTLDDISHINDSRPHWHQRNQDVMCNGIDLKIDKDNNSENGVQSITRNQVGQNVTGGGDGYVTHDDFRNWYGQYYAAEIYNEVNSLTQTLHGATIPNLVDGLYKFTAQALYYDDDQGTTNNGVAYFLVKREELDDAGHVIEDKTTTELMPIKPMNSESHNITAHSGVSAGYVFNNNENAYLLTTFVEINGKTNLTIGIVQTQDVGWTVIGNVHLYAHGKQAMYVDEDWTDNETLTYIEGDREKTRTGNPYTLAKWHDNYDYPSTVYFQRTFTVGKWNPICMPLSLTGRQVRQAFGADAKVCAFIGQDTNLPDGNGCILFQRPVDLDQAENLDQTVIQAGTPYIIYVSSQPQHPNGITAEVGNGAYNHTITIEGATYAIPGVLKEQLTAWQHKKEGQFDENGEQIYELDPPTVVEPAGTDIKFVGTFYKDKILATNIHNELQGKNDGSNDYWVITRGNMYHLTGQIDYPVYATYAYLYMPVSTGGNASGLTFAIDEDGVVEPTTIEDLFIDTGNGIDYGKVYNMSGQIVASGSGSLEDLPKGIYLLNGKKFVVK